MNPESDMYPEDPVGDAISDSLRKAQCDSLMDSKAGVVIIFHGAPYTGETKQRYRQENIFLL